MIKHLPPRVFVVASVLTMAPIGAYAASAEVNLGERLFRDPRFARSPAQQSCASCHRSTAPDGSPLAFADAEPLSTIPRRDDGLVTTPRHASSLVGTSSDGGWGLLHWDGEFGSLEELVAETFVGRNFGWLPDERAAAVAHFARAVRSEPGDYAMAWREIGSDIATASDEQMLALGARTVAAFVRTLQLSRDKAGFHNGSPYDAFLAANRLPRAPNPGETPHEYARRLHAAVAALRKPIFVDESVGGLASAGPAFRFGAEELRGLRIFFRGAMGYVRSASAGNCAECHVPPHFTDLAFHNTGATQDRYDAVHGTGAFAQLTIPTLAEREAEPARWLPPSAAHPRAAGPWRSIPSREDAARADVGLWNVYANAALPGPQSRIELQLNRNGTLSRETVLAVTLARFKTPGLRNSRANGRLLHDGSAETVEQVISLYVRMSELARSGKMRNPPPEFAAMSLAPEDVQPLAAFLQSLNEKAAP
jgi:cytochrome c peroxidase